MIKATGYATLRDKESGEFFEVHPDQLSWNQDGGDERGMGTELLYTASVSFDRDEGGEIACEWTISEYPVGVINHVSLDPSAGVEVDDGFRFYCEYEADRDDEET